MGNYSMFAARMAAVLVLHAAGAGLASPTVLVTRPQARMEVEWLPNDNQTLYKLLEGESKTLELNTTSILHSPVFITISPCTEDFHWILYHGKSHNQGAFTILNDYSGREMRFFSIFIGYQDRYILKLSTTRGGAGVVSVRGEATKSVRLRLRTRSRRRLVANWNPSPIDPQATTYCVVVSHSKNYTSLCEARCDAKANRIENKSFERYNDKDRFDDNRSKFDCSDAADVDNKIVANPFSLFESTFKNIYRRKKFGRSTKAKDENPVIACVGERTHHLIENLDSTKTYYVSVFGIANDRQFGSLLGSGTVRPKTSTAKRLKENVPYRADIRGRAVYYFKTSGSTHGLWVSAAACGGAVDVEVLLRGKRLHLLHNIESYSKFYVPSPIPNSSIQETSDEGSIQFDSSSEEARMRFVIKVTPSKWDRDRSINVEVAVSTSRWGVNMPELVEDGSIVRELKPKRSCRSVDVAFLPAWHNATSFIRYCIIVRESSSGDNFDCSLSKKDSVRTQCFNCSQRQPTKAIVQKINGLRSGKKYAIQVTAATKGTAVRYRVLYADTNVSCKDDIQ